MSRFSKHAKVLSYLYDILAGCAALMALLITVNFEWTINIAVKVIAFLKGPGGACVSERDLMKIKYVLGIHTFVWIYAKTLFWRVEASKKEILSAIDEKITAVDSASNECRADLIKRLLISCGVLKQSQNSKSHKIDVKKAIPELLTLVTRYMHNWPVKLDSRFGSRDAGVESDFYIYTLAASHQEEDLAVMRKYLKNIVQHIVADNQYNQFDAGSKTRHLPVLVVPQDRNVILAEAIADGCKVVDNTIGMPILTYQPSSGKQTDLNPEFPYELFYRIFQGCDALKKKLRVISAMGNVRKIVLHMILIDCNVTRGTSMVNIVKDERIETEFKQFVNAPTIIEELSPSITCSVEFDQVRDCATLFIASDGALTDSSESLNRKFALAGLRLWYYFVLPEAVKRSLWEMRTKCAGENCNSYTFSEVLRLSYESQDRLKKITGMVNGWINDKATSMENFVQCLECASGSSEEVGE